MLGSFFFLSDSVGPLEWASFLRLLVLKGQQFKHLDYRRNVFHFPFKKKSPIQTWSRKPNWLEHFGSMSVKLENNTDITALFWCLRGSNTIYSGVLISWFYLVFWAPVSICRTTYNRHQHTIDTVHQAPGHVLALLASYSRISVPSSAWRIPGHHFPFPQLLLSETKMKRH